MRALVSDIDYYDSEGLSHFFSRCLSKHRFNRRRYEFPMVFGSETEFGLTYGRVLDKGVADFFPIDSPEIVFLPIIKKVAEKTKAFARNPMSPWLRSGLNHLDRTSIDKITEAAISDDISCLPVKVKKTLKRTRLSARDFYLGETGIFLEEGSRLYIDGTHLESSISECREPSETVCHEKAMERIITGVLPELENVIGREIIILKDNTDRHGNSYGCHTNYLLKLEFFNQLYVKNEWSNAWLSFITSGIIITGSGKVGYECDGEPCDYQISQRADHFMNIFGGSTMHNRPLINFRDEPLADNEKYGRFHVILDDSNMAEWSIYLKIGTKALVLNMLQHQFFEGEKTVQYKKLFIDSPIESLKFISRDLTCKKKILLSDGNEKSALEIQEEWLSFVEDFYSSSDFYPSWIPDVIAKWKLTLQWIRDNDDNLDSVLDWRIKLSLIKGMKEKYAEKGITLDWQSGRIKNLDCLYHNLGPIGLYNRTLKAGHIKRIVTDEHIERAKTEPSENTRAWLRGRFIKHFLPHLVDASWELLAFHIKIGDFETLVSLEMDPLRSTRREVGELFAETDNYESFCMKFLSMYLSDRSLF
ncbi:MAG: proteasome accessory factor PafA2 family protein [Candidatus Azambacteria bacterium]|nr:proteasome accessory factor PafA2 family protein [Candidatus Azambacteria bacterium]